MRILILGVDGMLGHKLYQVLASRFDVTGTIRGTCSDIRARGFFPESALVPDVNALEIARVDDVVRRIGPDVVINCIGIVKSLEKTSGRLLNIWVNSLFPHQLYECCSGNEARLIHISTDCVFSGRKGSYREDDLSDAEDIYGRTKYLGEVSREGALTIRTSLIGRELSTSNGLVEWFLSNQGGKVNGFTNAIFSGFPTLHFARILADVIARHRDLSGVYHVSTQPITKFKLLTLLRDKMGLDIEINEHPDFHCDRSLDSSSFRARTGFLPLPWDTMMAEFAEDALQYRQWR